MNAIDIFKQVGVLIAPISLEKEPEVIHDYRHIKLQLTVTDMANANLSGLDPLEINVLGMFIHHGGLGRESAMKMQKELWGILGGRSIHVLVSAIKKCGWDEKQVLWDMYPLGYKHKGG